MWYKQYGRSLPWRNTRDAYKIWLSEIILQQTRIAQGLPYYERYIEVFPTVMDLAQAPEDQVMKLWEGLGYYSRARNMHKAAKKVAFELEGQFPSQAADLQKLPGIGPYTAGAISSFAFDEKAALVDGNVQRVFARYYCVDEIQNSPSGQKVFWNIAHKIMEQVSEPAAYNSALMDLGSDVCTPKHPKCESCPLSDTCQAFKLNKVNQYPFKKTKTVVKERRLSFAFVQHQGHVAIQKRGEGDIWAGLFQFPILADSEKNTKLSDDYLLNRPLYRCTHKLTHRLLQIEILEVEKGAILLKEDVLWVKKDQLSTYGFPRPLKKFIDENLLLE